MAKLLSGKEAALSLTEELKFRAGNLLRRGAVPALRIIRVGSRPEDLSYEAGARKRCEMTGTDLKTIHLPDDVSQEELVRVIGQLNEDSSVHGVLLLRPLPKGIDEHLVANTLRPMKDVDGMTDLSLSGLITGRRIGFAPCTAEAAMAILDHYGIGAAGKRAVVIGRSLVFGKPAALMLTNRNATVTICHTKTVDLPAIARQADILMVSCGHARSVGRDYVRPGQTVIDVGINLGPDGHLCGDVAFDEVEPYAGAITPVPGGVGAVTTSILVRHVIEGCELMNSQ